MTPPWTWRGHLELFFSSRSQAASILAGLGEKGVEGSDMKACARALVRRRLDTVAPLQLLRLAVAATKSQPVATEALDAVAEAAALVLNAFNMEDASKLLLAVAKAKAAAGRDRRRLAVARRSRRPGALPEGCAGDAAQALGAVRGAVDQGGAGGDQGGGVPATLRGLGHGGSQAGIGCRSHEYAYRHMINL